MQFSLQRLFWLTAALAVAMGLIRWDAGWLLVIAAGFCLWYVRPVLDWVNRADPRVQAVIAVAVLALLWLLLFPAVQ